MPSDASCQKQGSKGSGWGLFSPWQNVFKQRKWNSLGMQPQKAQNNKWQRHFSAAVALTRGSAAATMLRSNVSVLLDPSRHTRPGLVKMSHIFYFEVFLRTLKNVREMKANAGCRQACGSLWHEKLFSEYSVCTCNASSSGAGRGHTSSNITNGFVANAGQIFSSSRPMHKLT